jgi:2-aminoadipate transaminase
MAAKTKKYWAAFARRHNLTLMTAISLNWNGLTARRAGLMKPSALRQLLKLLSRPGMISFAGGLPAAELFPLARVAGAVESTLKRVGPAALQYGETEGVTELREWIARRYSTPQLRLQTDNVLITSGSQQVLDLVGRVFLNSRDRVIVENPTYLAALQAWRAYETSFLPVAMDSEGIRTDEFQRQLKRQPKMAYVMPNFQNPTGVTMSCERRQRLVTLLQRHALFLVEDNPYEELRYESDPLPGLLDLDRPPDAGGRVIRAGTFSKSLMPGLRLGWAIGPKEVIGKLAKAKQAVDLHTSTFNQFLALTLLNEGYLEDSLPALRLAYRRRRDAMLAALQAHLPSGCRWTKPAGGMFIFVTLPKRLSAAALLPRALERNVAFVPGQDFHPDGSGGNTLRLNFTKTAEPEIAAGIERLSEVIRFCCTHKRQASSENSHKSFTL